MWARFDDKGDHVEVELHGSELDFTEQVREQIDYYAARGERVTKIILDNKGPKSIFDIPVEREIDSYVRKPEVSAQEFFELRDRVRDLEQYVTEILPQKDAFDSVLLRLKMLEESDVTHSHRYLRELLNLRNDIVDRLRERVTYLEKNVKWKRR